MSYAMLYQPEKVLSKKQVKQGFTNYPPHKTVDTYLVLESKVRICCRTVIKGTQLQTSDVR